MKLNIVKNKPAILSLLSDKTMPIRRPTVEVRIQPDGGSSVTIVQADIIGPVCDAPLLQRKVSQSSTLLSKVNNEPFVKAEKLKTEMVGDNQLLKSSGAEQTPSTSMTLDISDMTLKSEIVINLSQDKQVLELAAENEKSLNKFARKLESEFTAKLSPLEFATVSCRSIQIGSYITTETDDGPLNLTLAPTWINFTAPQCKSRVKGTAFISINNMTSIQACFSEGPSVVFLKTDLQWSAGIRGFLEMDAYPEAECANYYCPETGTKHQRHIAFVLDSLTQANVKLLYQLCGKKLIEISNDTANQLLGDITHDSLKSRIGDLPVFRRSNPSTEAIPLCPSPLIEIVDMDEDGVAADSLQIKCTAAMTSELDIEGTCILNYAGKCSSISITPKDIKCLCPYQYLNDQIVGFWLSVIHTEHLSIEDRQRTHIFDSSFYTKLTEQKKTRTAAEGSMTDAERRHAGVQRRTKNVDIFSKDFLIIPIIKEQHWVCLIVCFPGKMDSNKLDHTQEVLKMPLDPITSTRPFPSDPDVGIDNVGKSSPGVRGPESTAADQRVKRSCILLLDSLGMPHKDAIYSNIREYLKIEYKVKKLKDVEFDKNSIPGFMPKVPKQPNLSDCGVFLLHYVEWFFSNPIPTFDVNVMDLKDWFDRKIVSSKRKEMYGIIRDKIKETCPDNLTRLPPINFVTSFSYWDRHFGKAVSCLPSSSISKETFDAERIASFGIHETSNQDSTQPMDENSEWEDDPELDMILPPSRHIKPERKKSKRVIRLQTADAVLKDIDEIIVQQKPMQEEGATTCEQVSTDEEQEVFFRTHLVHHFEKWKSLQVLPLPIAQKENKCFTNTELSVPHLLFEDHQKQLKTAGFFLGSCPEVTTYPAFNDFVSDLGRRCVIKKMGLYTAADSVLQVKSFISNEGLEKVVAAAGASLPMSIISGIWSSVNNETMPATSYCMELLHKKWLEVTPIKNPVQLYPRVNPRTVAYTAGSLLPLRRTLLRLPKLVIMKCGYVAWMVVRPCKIGPMKIAKYLEAIESCSDPWVASNWFIDFFSADVDGNLLIDYEIVLQEAGEVLLLGADVLCQGVCLNDCVFECIPFVDADWSRFSKKNIMTTCRQNTCRKHNKVDSSSLRIVKRAWFAICPKKKGDDGTHSSQQTDVNNFEDIAETKSSSEETKSSSTSNSSTEES